MSNAASPLGALAQMRHSFADLQAGRLGIPAFSEAARSHPALLQALPPRYGEVLGQLLDRLESSALFSEESCSFSQRDLFDSLQLWIDKAAGQIGDA